MTLLGVLARAFGPPCCPMCRREMRLMDETQATDRPPVFELQFECVPCGEQRHVVKSYGFID